MDVMRAPYGRQPSTAFPSAVPGAQPAASGYQGATYYDRPAIKSSHYGQLIAGYLFIGGLAGASQLIASTADVVGREADRPIVRTGRYLALAGSLVSPVLLIADLHTPQRWYNMLRIFRSTSSMSIGAWTLTAFGTTSAATALAQLLDDRAVMPRSRRLGRWLSVPAALAGATMATYTGALLATTSTPLWASGERLLPALFGTSAASTATAALSLAQHLQGHSGSATRVEHLAFMAGAAELVIASATDRRWRQQGVAAPLRQARTAAAYRLGFGGLGIMAPLILHGINLLTRRRSRATSIVAAVATLAGGYLLRSTLISAGNQSAQRAHDYLRFTQPSAGSRQA